MTYCPALSLLSGALLQSLRVLIWTALVASAPAQLLPPRRESTVSTAASLSRYEDTAPTDPTPANPPNLFVRYEHWLEQLTELAALAEEEEPESPEPRPYAALILDNGQVFGLYQDLIRDLGLGPNQVSWAGSGGLAAYGADRVVRLRNPKASSPDSPLVWGETEHFLGNSQVLILGAHDADSTLIWDSAINLNWEERKIRIIGGIHGGTVADVRFDSALVGGSLLLEGDGRVDFTANNTGDRIFVGHTFIDGAELRLNGNGRLFSEIEIRNGGRFVIDNIGTSADSRGGTYLKDRLGSYGHIGLHAADFAYWGAATGNSSETLAQLSLYSGSNSIDVANNSRNGYTEIVVRKLRADPRATVNFTNSRGHGNYNPGKGPGAGNTPRIKLDDDIPALEDGILPWATVNGTDFATIRDNHIVAYTKYHRDGQLSWKEKHNASPLSNQYLANSRSLNSLRLENQKTSGLTITLHDTAILSLKSGGLLATGARANAILGGTLAITGSPLRVHVYGAGGLTISSVIAEAPGSPASEIGLIKTGYGTLRLNGDRSNTFTGDSYVHEGTLVLAKTGGALAIAGDITVGDAGAHDATLRLEASQQIHANAHLYLKGSNQPRRGRGILQVAGSAQAGIHQRLDSLRVDGHGIIEFSGGNTASPNILQIAFFEVGSDAPGTELLIRGWEQFHDHILVSRQHWTGGNHGLERVRFEGYEDGSAHLIDYDADYFEIVPTWFHGVPEPASTGAALIAGALGLAAWRKRRGGRTAPFTRYSQSPQSSR